jgi:hypothetical protein
MNSNEYLTLKRVSAAERMPASGTGVLTETADGGFYVAARVESLLTKNVFRWMLLFEAKPIGIVVNVVNWYE